ncbi:T9SS type A sorting domain-containing protein [Crocinitomix catalasitica]|uniref:T9SS type A sorting domain-containing protein n=1 Tax=Crocinitomix catalasitica TaxID=184607 RepID=UPI00047FFB07|nr:T9SS type A sorting domain-containing protein [Crocinitomix catalasitica]
MKEVSLFIALLLSCSSSFSQIINGYARVTGISDRVFTLNNVNETGDTFEDDEWVVVMQMQDDVIGITTNTADFGSLGSISSAGLYEIRQIESHTESGGEPATITLRTSPVNSYNIGDNSRVQIITFPELGSPNYTTTGNMTSQQWNGNIGGVLAFEVEGTLTLEHNLDADEDGFRGANANAGSSSGCDGSANYIRASHEYSADKGEGIYRVNDATYEAGRAKILNGGGGGNSHNAGGGGGGNFSAGGLGGPGYPTCSPSAGGIGGLYLSNHISASRIFMGGGGGAGEGNNDYATNGADGGGIILIKANEIETVSCAGVSITANAESILIAPGNDGGGGGGAGGSIVFEVETWSIAGGCPLTIQANGGNGGSVGSSATHGGGGGGGQGTIIFSSAEPTVNVNLETQNGTGGCNNNSDPCSSRADSGAGVDDLGIFDALTGPLPIELVKFEGLFNENEVQLDWKTSSESNNDFFTIYKSKDGNKWEILTKVKGAGNSTLPKKYQTFDFNPHHGINYYKLEQTDFDGSIEAHGIISVVVSGNKARIYPNPTTGKITIEKEFIDLYDMYLTDILGRKIPLNQNTYDFTRSTVDLGYFPNGVYTLTLSYQNQFEQHKLVISK